MLKNKWEVAMKCKFLNLVFGIFILCSPCLSFSAEITEKLSLSGTVTTVYQWLNKSKGEVPNTARGSVVIDSNLSFRPTEYEEFFLRGSFAKGSGFHGEAKYPFVLNPNVDDLFIDLKDINGHGRDHLQELWYSRKFNISKENLFQATLGLIQQLS